MRALLDINVLLALLDADHAHHREARRFIAGHIELGWASCAITQNGFVRIISQPRYPSPVSTTVAIRLLTRATATDHHRFWPCESSLLDPETVDPTRIHGPRQVTDAYLLALAVARHGHFVTFDQRLSLDAVPGATHEHLIML